MITQVLTQFQVGIWLYLLSIWKLLQWSVIYAHYIPLGWSGSISKFEQNLVKIIVAELVSCIRHTGGIPLLSWK